MESVTPNFITFNALKRLLELWLPNGLDAGWQVPSNLQHGLFASNVAFRASKGMGMAPDKAAAQLATDLEIYLSAATAPLVVRVAGPYINVTLTDAFWPVLLNQDLQKNLVESDQRRVMFEYIGANVAKRLHAGHMRNLNIGDALRRVLQLKYPNLITDNHWGDWGVQFGVVLWAYKRAVDQDAYAHDAVGELQRLYVWGASQEPEVPGWKDEVRAEFVKLEAGDAENRELWSQFVQVSRQSLQRELALFGVPDTDLHQGESFYEPDMKVLSEFMDEHSFWHREGKARYVDYDTLAMSWSGLPPLVVAKVKTFGRCYLISSDGYTTYAFRDVAARWQWARDHRIDLAITVTDITQAHNFNQAFALISYLASTTQFKSTFGPEVAERLAWHKLVHVGYGFLQLTSGKMSTRKGQVLGLSQLLSEVEQAAQQAIIARDKDLLPDEIARRARVVALASLKWADLNRDPSSEVVLDPTRITAFEGNTGTYQLYTYARLVRVMRKLGDTPNVTLQSSQLTDLERELLARLYVMPLTIAATANEYRPNLLVNHLLEVTELANRWYVAAPKFVQMAADDPRRLTAHALIHQVTSQLQFGLGLLGIETLEQL